MSSAGRPSRFACRCAIHSATTIDGAIRIPYQRMTTGPSWKAMAPGELMTVEDSMRGRVLCSTAMPRARVVFLGTGGALNPERYQAALLVERGDTRCLLDTGGGLGVVRRLLAAEVDPSQRRPRLPQSPPPGSHRRPRATADVRLLPELPRRPAAATRATLRAARQRHRRPRLAGGRRRLGRARVRRAAGVGHARGRRRGGARRGRAAHAGARGSPAARRRGRRLRAGRRRRARGLQRRHAPVRGA